MKILHIIFTMTTGGTETMLIDIANEQARRGHDVEILIVNNQEDASVMAALSPQVKVSRFHRVEGTGRLKLLLRLNAFALLRHPDAIHLHMHKLTGLLHVLPSRTFFTVHALNIPMVYARKSHMAAISKAVEEDVRSRVPDADISTILNGINTDAITPRPARKPDSRFRIVQVARLMTEIKGQDILIDALAMLRRRGYNATVTFIGGGDDLDSLRNMAQEKGVADAVDFKGNMQRADIYRSLCQYDIMCHPSRYEGFGLTIAEGMVAGLPVAVPEGGGPWEVCNKGELSFVFKNGDAQSCADALAKIMDNYPEALALAETAKAYAKEKYSIHRQVDEYLNLYKKERITNY